MGIVGEHVDENLLERYAMQTATPEEVTVIEQHLLVCGVCCDRLALTEEFISAFRAFCGDQKRPIALTHHTSSGRTRVQAQRCRKHGT
jgi:hypothetical protein